MEDKSKYFVVKQKAVPEVLLKVVEAKKLLETERAITVRKPRIRWESAGVPFISTRMTYFPVSYTHLLLGIMWTGKKSNTFFVQSAWLTISLKRIASKKESIDSVS